MQRAEAARDEQARRLADAETRLTEWTVDPAIDAALDYYRELQDLIAGRVDRADGAEEVNAALRSLLDGMWLDVVERPVPGMKPARMVTVRIVARDQLVTSGVLLGDTRIPLPGRAFDRAEPDGTPSCTSTR